MAGLMVTCIHLPLHDRCKGCQRPTGGQHGYLVPPGRHVGLVAEAVVSLAAVIAAGLHARQELGVVHPE